MSAAARAVKRHEYTCSIQYQPDDGSWYWAALFEGKQFAQGSKKLRYRAETAAERACKVHADDVCLAELRAQEDEVKATGKTWTPWV